MTGRERVITALGHREPDRVPYDLAGTTATGISRGAFLRAMAERGLPADFDLAVADPIQNIVTPSEDVLFALGSDTRRVGARRIQDFENVRRREGDAWIVTDAFGCEWRMAEGRDVFFNLTFSPLRGFELLSEGLKQWAKPRWNAAAGAQMEGDLERQAEALDENCGVADRNCAGLTEVSSRIRGAELWFMDTILEPASVETLLDILLEYKIDYWRSFFDWLRRRGLGGKIQVLSECDDLGTQTSTLTHPDWLRRIVLPRWKTLWTFQKKEFPAARIFMHSCGAIRPIIPELIEAGMEILNPVQFTAAGMDLSGLKKDFGRDIAFWGGGVDTQSTLVKGTPQEVADEVKRILDIMAPGGGFVFAPVHNVQDDVPAANSWAMWETLQDYGRY